MKRMSIWEDVKKKHNYKKLNEDIKVDVLIIGGGISGISTAYHLRKSHLKVCVVEKNIIGSGVTSKTTGKLTYLQGLIYTKLNNDYNFNVAYKYYQSQKDALAIVKDIITMNKIACDLKESTSSLFASKICDIPKLKYEKHLLEKMGITIKENQYIPYNITSYYNINVYDTYLFHPLKYLYTLAHVCFKNGIDIYEHTCIYNIKKVNDSYVCDSDKNKIYAKKIIFCGHYPFFLKPFFFPLKAHLERSYMTAGEVLDKKQLNGINTDKKSLSYRFHEDKKNNYFLFLSNSHSLAFKMNINKNYVSHLKKLKNLKIPYQYVWSNIDIITPDNLPYIGLLEDNLYIATGYNTWGMTNGSLAGKIIADLIEGRKNPYIELFSPTRKMPFFNSLKYLYNVFASAKPFVENKIIKNKKYYKNNVFFKKENGKDIAIYVDENKQKHIVYNKCPHLKCNLIFNEVDLTWDCPCHSSRFDIDGKCIKGPSNYDITYKKA